MHKTSSVPGFNTSSAATRPKIRSARDEIFRQSEELEREAVRKIKNGTYYADGFLDDDGLGSDPVKINMKVIVEDEKITIDLEGSANQTQGPVNCGFAQTISACRVAFKLLINPKRPVPDPMSNIF